MIEVVTIVLLGVYGLGGIFLLVWHGVDAVVAVAIEDNRALRISCVGMAAAPFWPITLPAYLIHERRTRVIAPADGGTDEHA